MELTGVTWCGPDIDDRVFLECLPGNLCGVLESINGFIQFQGGLHFRGACSKPEWHSLRSVWKGGQALHKLYEDVGPEDIPFAQDCVGDQFLLRSGAVLRLNAETGAVEPFASGLATFLEAANEDPVHYLSLEPLLQLQREGGALEPGQLVHAFPPFCTKEAADGISLRAVPAFELLAFHASLASNLPPDGSRIRMRVMD